MSISWSDDGGYSFKTPRLRRLGPQGKAGQRVSVLNTGMTGPQGRQWKLQVADPVHVGFQGAAMAAEPRSE